jgi:hypothetical protein
VRRAALLLAVIVAGCAPATPQPAAPAPAPAPSAALDLGLAEAVFRHLFATSGRPISAPIATYCIATGVTNATVGDPPPELVRRLADIRPSVKPSSACATGPDDITDTASGGFAILYKLSDIACADADHCTVMGGYVANSANGRGSQYQLERRGGQWRVTGEQIRVVS